MMRWGRKKSVSTSSASSSSGLSRALPVSWFSKLSGSSDLKPTKEKKQDDKASKNMSAKSSTKPRNDTRESSGRFNRVLVEKETRRTKSDEKFEEIMSSVKKKVKEFQIETRGYLEAEATVIMTPRLKVNRDKVRCERRDQRLLEQKAMKTEQETEIKAKKVARRITRSHSREDSLLLDNTETKPAPQWQKLKEVKLREVKLKADQQRKSLYVKRELNSKVRVFSPRASEKCRVKAIEDLKKAKLRAREHEIANEEGGMESESFAVVKCSSDPRKDFRDSMIEMIMENGINHPEELKELLVCYLRLNTDEYHDMIIKVFQEVYNDLKFHYFGAE